MTRWIVVMVEHDEGHTVVVDAEDGVKAIEAAVHMTNMHFEAANPLENYVARAWELDKVEPGYLDAEEEIMEKE
jgi:hypothetical protein